MHAQVNLAPYQCNSTRALATIKWRLSYFRSLCLFMIIGVLILVQCCHIVPRVAPLAWCVGGIMVIKTNGEKFHQDNHCVLGA